MQKIIYMYIYILGFSSTFPSTRNFECLRANSILRKEKTRSSLVDELCLEEENNSFQLSRISTRINLFESYGVSVVEAVDRVEGADRFR